jgi:chromosomal replication initiator protein
MQGFWDSCLNRFEKELPTQQFNTWIRPLRMDVSAVPSGELRLLAPNHFVLQWVKERFLNRIEVMGAEFFA